MPLQRCTSNTRPGWRWGAAGKCYTYTAGSSDAEAKRRAVLQGVAMGESSATTNAVIAAEYFIQEASRRYAKKAEAAMQKEFVRHLTKVLNAVDADVAKALRSGAIDMNDIRRSDQAVRNAFGLSKAEFNRAYRNFTLKAGSMGRDAAIRDFKLGLDFGDLNPHTQGLLEKHAIKACERTMERMTGNVMSTLKTSYDNGDSYYMMRSAISQDFTNMKGYELDRIARTETHSATQQGNNLACGEAGVEYTQWITTGDTRVRHPEMHGQIVRQEGLFTHPIEGWTMLYPGDDSSGADPDAFINCRCFQVPFWMPAGMTAPNMPYFYEEDLVEAPPPTSQH